MNLVPFQLSWANCRQYKRSLPQMPVLPLPVFQFGISSWNGT